MTDLHSRKSGPQRRPVPRTKSRRKGQRVGPNRGKGRKRRQRRAATTGGLSGRNEGCSVVLMVVERVGRRLDRVTSKLQISSIGTGWRGKPARSRKWDRRASKSSGQFPARACQAMFALGHVQRMRIMRKLLDGPAIYQALKKLTRLKSGPLYHHINHLRLAGLLLPKQRDLYELTRAGRNAVLGVMAMGSLVGDSRPRPGG